MDASWVDIEDNYAQSIIVIFGERLVRISRPVWKIRGDALSETNFVHWSMKDATILVCLKDF